MAGRPNESPPQRRVGGENASGGQPKCTPKVKMATSAHAAPTHPPVRICLCYAKYTTCASATDPPALRTKRTQRPERDDGLLVVRRPEKGHHSGDDGPTWAASAARSLSRSSHTAEASLELPSACPHSTESPDRLARMAHGPLSRPPALARDAAPVAVQVRPSPHRRPHNLRGEDPAVSPDCVH